MLAPPEGCVICSRSSGSKTPISVNAQAVELRPSISVPVEGQFRSAVEAIAVVIGSPSQCPYGLVEVLEHLPPVLERTSFVLTSPSLSFPLSFSSPNLVFTLVGPSLCYEPTSDASGESACHPDAGYYQRRPKWRSGHASMMVDNADNLVGPGMSRHQNSGLQSAGNTWAPARGLDGGEETCAGSRSRSPVLVIRGNAPLPLISRLATGRKPARRGESGVPCGTGRGIAAVSGRQVPGRDARHTG